MPNGSHDPGSLGENPPRKELVIPHRYLKTDCCRGTNRPIETSVRGNRPLSHCASLHSPEYRPSSIHPIAALPLCLHTFTTKTIVRRSIRYTVFPRELPYLISIAAHSGFPYSSHSTHVAHDYCTGGCHERGCAQDRNDSTRRTPEILSFLWRTHLPIIPPSIACAG